MLITGRLFSQRNNGTLWLTFFIFIKMGGFTGVGTRFVGLIVIGIVVGRVTCRRLVICGGFGICRILGKV